MDQDGKSQPGPPGRGGNRPTDLDGRGEPGSGPDAGPDADWLVERLTDDWGWMVRSKRLLERLRSPFQAIEVHATEALGRVYSLDGRFMAAESDEFICHENLVHVAALCHPAPRRALIVGGGDGGSARELLRHPSITQVTICELDAAVVDVARRHLGSIHQGALDDPRVSIVIGDGEAFVAGGGAGDGRDCDLIVLDLTDPVPDGLAARLHEPPFFDACARRLAPGGALTLHVGSPVAHPQRVRTVLASLGEVFSCVRPFQVAIPLYGGPWLLACATQGADPAALSPGEIDARIAARGIVGLRWVNGAVCHGSFALPNFVRDLVPAGR